MSLGSGFECLLCTQNRTRSVFSWAWCHLPVIPALGRLKQEDGEFKAGLGYTLKPIFLKKKKKKEKGGL